MRNEMNNIKNIDIKKLWPHPDNPRKDLGDLSELAESIKVNGILQNLTVVPWFSEITGVGCDDSKSQEDMGYRVVVGHRRLEAAKLAGLTELPCVISDIGLRDQVATMLSENIQRADLTIYEQAQGFQMMMDLGDTVQDVADKTGFSDTTIRRRVKLLELDPEKFKASAERNVTLMDYVELEKIEDITLRNKVLDSIGTSNFRYELQRAIDVEKNEKNMVKLVEKLNTFAIQTDNSSGLKYVTTYYLSRDEEAQVPDDAGNAKYFYTISNYGYISLYSDAVETEESVASKENKEMENIKYKLNDITQTAYNLRSEFVKKISNAEAKKHISVIIEYSVRLILENYITCDVGDLAKMLDISFQNDKEDEGGFNDIVEGLRKQPERYLLLVTYIGLDSQNLRYYKYGDCSYNKSEDLDTIYAFLEGLGYETSDEENAMRNGTHELFDKLGR